LILERLELSIEAVIVVYILIYYKQLTTILHVEIIQWISKYLTYKYVKVVE
jgi:hypothetical protein